MKEIRIRFQKTAMGQYISHLDVNRMFGRALNRLNIPVRYTEGFNPHAYLVFGPPLSVGFTGNKEILDISLTEDMKLELIQEKLGATLAPMGIVICDVYEPKDKIKEIAHAAYEAKIYWEKSMDTSFLSKVQAYFSGSAIPVCKRTKKGEREINLADMIEEIHFTQSKEGELSFSATVVCSGQDNLNPEYITKAIAEKFGVDVTFATYVRRQFYTNDKKAFN